MGIRPPPHRRAAASSTRHHRAHRRGPATRRLPELGRAGPRRRAALPGHGDGPRALLRRAPVPSGGRTGPLHWRPGPARGGGAPGHPPARDVRPGRPPGTRRPPRGRDGPGRAVPGDRQPRLSGAGLLFRGRPRAPADVRPPFLGHLLLGPGPDPRTAQRGRPRCPRGVPRGRRRRRRCRDGRHRAARDPRPPVRRDGSDEDLPHRGPGFPVARRIVRRSLRAAPGPRLRGNVRRRRRNAMGVAHAAGHGQRRVFRHHRAQTVQRFPRRCVSERRRVLLQQPPCRCGPALIRTTNSAPPTAAAPGSPPPAARRT